MDIEKLIECLRNAKEPNMGLTDCQSVEQDAIDAIKMLRAERDRIAQERNAALKTINAIKSTRAKTRPAYVVDKIIETWEKMEALKDG